MRRRRLLLWGRLNLFQHFSHVWFAKIVKNDLADDLDNDDDCPNGSGRFGLVTARMGENNLNRLLLVAIRAIGSSSANGQCQ